MTGLLIFLRGDGGEVYRQEWLKTNGVAKIYNYATQKQYRYDFIFLLFSSLHLMLTEVQGN